jgi:hypothetical protein
MTYKISITSGTLMIAALSGCTHLEVNKVTGVGTEISRSGYAYSLDYTDFEIKLTRTLVACGSEPKIKIEASVTPGLAPDGEHVYTINPNSLISAFKTSDITIEYKDGRLVSFNANTEDKTGEFVASVATTATKIAGLALGIPVPLGVRESLASSTLFEGKLVCTKAAEDSLGIVKDAPTTLEPLNQQLSRATSDLAALTAQYAEKPSVALKRNIEAKTSAIEEAQAAIDTIIKTIANAQAWLKHEVTVTWPEQSTEFATPAPVYPVPSDKLMKWFDKPIVKSVKSSDPEAGLRGATADKVEKALWADAGKSVLFRIKPRGSFGSVSTDRRETDNAKAGLRYRVPAAAWLFVCDGNDADKCGDTGSTPVAKVASSVAQLGPIFNVPFSSPAFASGGISFSLDDQGRLQKAGLKRTNSSALAAADAAGSIADSATDLATSIREAPLNDLKARAEIAKAKKDLADAENALIKSPKAQLEEEFAILEAQKKLADLRAEIGPNRSTELAAEIKAATLEVELAELRKKIVADPNAAEAEVRQGLDAETSVLEAQRNKFEAEVATLRAERALAAARTP